MYQFLQQTATLLGCDLATTEQVLHRIGFPLFVIVAASFIQIVSKGYLQIEKRLLQEFLEAANTENKLHDKPHLIGNSAFDKPEIEHISLAHRPTLFLNDIILSKSLLSFCNNDLRYYLSTKMPLKIKYLYLALSLTVITIASSYTIQLFRDFHIAYTLTTLIFAVVLAAFILHRLSILNAAKRASRTSDIIHAKL